MLTPMHKSTSLLFILLWLGTTYCTRSFEIEVEDPGPLISVNSLFNTDAPWQVELVETLFIENDTGQSMEEVYGATVQLYVQGQLIAVATEVEEDFEHYYDLGVVAEPNVEYELVVSHPDYPTCRAVTSVPDRPQTSAFHIPDEVFEAPLQEIVGHFTLTDPGEERNFYHFSYTHISRHIQERCCGQPYDTTLRRLTTDLNIEDLGIANTFNIVFAPSQLFGTLTTDRLVDGGTSVINFSTYNALYYHAGRTLYRGELAINHLSYDLYRFMQSLKAVEQANNLSFVRPEPLYSNVEGGLGIVAGFSQTVYSVEAQNFDG